MFGACRIMRIMLFPVLLLRRSRSGGQDRECQGHETA
jgi:hypothetical protein